MKSKYFVFSGYKQKNNMCFVYSERELQQNSYDWCIFKLKSQRTVEATYLESANNKRHTADVFRC